MARRAQMELPLPATWGGRRAGAGRKSPSGRPEKRHAVRPAHEPRHPVLVTVRAKPNVPSLRSLATFDALSAALARAGRNDFRVTHFSVQTDHVHLIVEATSRDALIAGLHGLAARTARAINRRLRRTGKVWNSRYHARALATPREVRNGLVYVLLNFRKHLRVTTGTDPRSSAAWFGGARAQRRALSRQRPADLARRGRLAPGRWAHRCTRRPGCGSYSSWMSICLNSTSLSA